MDWIALLIRPNVRSLESRDLMSRLISNLGRRRDSHRAPDGKLCDPPLGSPVKFGDLFTPTSCGLELSAHASNSKWRVLPILNRDFSESRRTRQDR